MKQFLSAYELLEPGEKALVVFTDGHHLTDNKQGSVPSMSTFCFASCEGNTASHPLCQPPMRG